MFADTRSQGEDGASAVEYGLLVVAVAALITALVSIIGGLVRDTVSGTCTEINSAMTATANCT